MPIDPSDRVADENRQSERKRAERGDERAREQRAQQFQAQVKGALQQKKSADLVQKKNERPELSKNSSEAGSDKEKVLFHKIVEAVKSQDKKTSTESQAGKKLGEQGLDELDRDKLKRVEHDSDKSKIKGERDGGHKKIESPDHQEDAGEDTGRQQHQDEEGGGGSAYSGSQNFGGGGASSDSGFSGDSSRQNDNPLFALRQEFEATQKSAGGTSSFGGDSSGRGHLKQEILDEMVAHIEVTLQAGQAQEMELVLSDTGYQGLRFRVAKSDQGISVTFICPTAAIKKQLLLDRPNIYAQLKQKKVRVKRIDII